MEKFSYWVDPTIDELKTAIVDLQSKNLFLERENKDLKSIIKEVREKIKSLDTFYSDNEEDTDTYIKIVDLNELLEILDKKNITW